MWGRVLVAADEDPQLAVYQPGHHGLAASERGADEHQVENAFRQMRDNECIAIRPQCQWRDWRIEVHVFCCVLALAQCGLLQREPGQAGIRCPVPALLAELSEVRAVKVDALYPPREAGGGPWLRPTLSQTSARQRALDNTLGLEKHLSAPGLPRQGNRSSGP